MRIGTHFIRFLPCVVDYCNFRRSFLTDRQFLSPYKIALPKDAGYTSSWTAPGTSFWLEAVDEVIDLAAGTRSFTLQVHHPGLIWTGMSNSIIIL
jgi:hypothetical protein